MPIYLYMFNKAFLCVSKEEKKARYGMQALYYNDSLIHFDNMMYLCITSIFLDFYKFCIHNTIMLILQ